VAVEDANESAPKNSWPLGQKTPPRDMLLHRLVQHNATNFFRVLPVLQYSQCVKRTFGAWQRNLWTRFNSRTNCSRALQIARPSSASLLEYREALQLPRTARTRQRTYSYSREHISSGNKSFRSNRVSEPHPSWQSSLRSRR